MRERLLTLAPLDGFNALLAAMAVFAWLAALYGASRAPWVPDLYNLVNANSRPDQPESSAVYLFAFPAILTTYAAIHRLAPDYMFPPRSRRIGGLLKASYLLAGAAFLAMTLARVLAAAALGE